MSSLKVLHTSDWHLGKKLFSASRLEEQILFLDFLYKEIRDNNINLLLIAGDIFDVPNPPHDAMRVFYEFIFKLGKLKNFTCILITGNHDSEALFNIPKNFFEVNNCYIYNEFDTDEINLEHYIEWNDKVIGIKLLPYFRNHQLLKKLPNPLEAKSVDIENYFQTFFNTWSKDPDFKILMSHHCFGPYSAAGSEQAIFLSGLDHIPLNWVTSSFDYIALGHIHKKQVLSDSPPVVYPGSPYPLRFSESNHKKIAVFDCTREMNLNFIEVPNQRQLIQLKTNLDNYRDEVLNIIKRSKLENISIYLEVIITLHKPQSGIAEEIQNLCHHTNVELLMLTPQFKIQDNEKNSKDLEELNLNDLFKSFFKEKYGEQEIPTELLETFQQILEESKDEISSNHHH